MTLRDEEYTGGMCGRIVRDDDIDWVEYLTGVESATRIAPDLARHLDRYVGRYNIAPTQEDIILRPAAGGGREVAASRWGLIPRWAKDRAIASRTFNARSETLLERPSFKGLVAGHRSVTPVSGYYEWRRVGKQKVPTYIHRADGRPLALAGLWTTWVDPEHEGKEIVSHTIITCAASDVLAHIHDRMPVVLDGEALRAWLDPEERDKGALVALLRPAADDRLATRAVSTLVNTVRNDGPELIEPAEAA
jgi:putative SOS response-associated peptidase YedK